MYIQTQTFYFYPSKVDKKYVDKEVWIDGKNFNYEFSNENRVKYSPLLAFIEKFYKRKFNKKSILLSTSSYILYYDDANAEILGHFYSND